MSSQQPNGRSEFNWDIVDRRNDTEGIFNSDSDLESKFPSRSTLTGVSEAETRSLPSSRIQKMESSLNGIARKYEIRASMAARLTRLRDYEIVIVCDDSGSMNTPIDGSQRTRWDLLRDIVKLILEISVIFDSNGVDIYFLNQDPILNVKDPAHVIEIFSARPSGYTPLAFTLAQVFQLSPSRRGHEKKLLVFVATDGVPTNEYGNEDIASVDRIMREGRCLGTTFVSFLICTDDRESVAYLNEWDQTMTNVDVTDDFTRERERVRQYRGPTFPFSMDDCVVKALVGAIDLQINRINEPSPDVI